MNRWQFALHQQALEEIDGLRLAERREVRAVFLRLVEDPWQKPDAQIRPPNDRAYNVKKVRSVRIVDWLDAFAREVLIVRIEPVLRKNWINRRRKGRRRDGATFR